MPNDPSEMTRTGDDGPSAVFAKLAEMVYNGDDFAQVYQAICDAAATLVPGCAHASLMLKENDRHVTVAASDGIAAQVDALERAEQEGPCLDAIENDAPQVETELARSTQWPRFGGAPGGLGDDVTHRQRLAQTARSRHWELGHRRDLTALAFVSA